MQTVASTVRLLKKMMPASVKRYVKSIHTLDKVAQRLEQQAAGSIPASKVGFRFDHGLGDNVLMAWTIPLYVKRGYKINVHCSPEKAFLFQLAGATVKDEYDAVHEFPHPPAVGHVECWNVAERYPPFEISDAYRSSKVAYSLQQGPLPKLGEDPKVLWSELKEVKLDYRSLLTDEIKVRIDEYIRDLPKPIILFHPLGGPTARGTKKNISDADQVAIIHQLLSRLPGTVVTLDWTGETCRVGNYRSRRTCDGLKSLSVLELLYLMDSSGLFIGIDSGPLHCAMLTDVPAIGVWPSYYPSLVQIPRKKTLNLVNAAFRDLDPYRRIEFNTVLSPEGAVTPNVIGETAEMMLSQPRWLDQESIVQDIQLQNFLKRTRGVKNALTSFVDRDKTFGLVMDYLKSIDNPVVVETGVIRAREDWAGAGFSTYLFSSFLSRLGKGTYCAIDLNSEYCGFAKEWTRQFGARAQIVCGHSHEELSDPRRIPTPIDVFYSDSLDTDVPGAEESCLKEIQLALPLLRNKNSLILIDDSPFSGKKFTGKGALAIPYLLENGWEVYYSGYQCLLRQKCAE